jgi:iron complex transport system substrate-binding protein
MSGQEARVDRIWGRYWRERQEVIDDISSCKTAPKILVIETVSYTFWSNPNQSFFNNNLESICGFNIGKLMPTRNGNLNLEEFFNLDPDIIYINPYILGDTDIKVWSILEDPRFQGLKAVKNKRVYHMPMGASRLEGPVEAPLSMLWLRMTLHPDQPTSLDIREKIRDTYKFIYDYNITDGEINKWLRLTENSYSSHYSDLFAIN